MQAISTVT